MAEKKDPQKPANLSALGPRPVMAKDTALGPRPMPKTTAGAQPAKPQPKPKEG